MNGTRIVFLAPRAEADIDAISAWIAERGAPVSALNYAMRIRRYLVGFEQFAERGSLHDEVRSGLRTVGFERRITIAFIVRDSSVEILRVFYGGQDWRRAFAEDAEGL